MGNVQTAASAHDVPWRQTPSGDLVDLGRPFRAPLALARLQSTPQADSGAARSHFARCAGAGVPWRDHLLAEPEPDASVAGGAT